MEYVITLVHGTFAKRASWTRDGSALCQTLRESLGTRVVFRPFIWSGRNSARARLEGARELSRHLQKLQREYPDAQHFVVGHSHGGNVALRALYDDPSVQGSVKGVACLSTPFVHITKRQSLLNELGAMLAIGSGLVGGPLVLYLWALTFGLPYWAPHWVVGLLLPYTFLAGGVLVPFLLLRTERIVRSVERGFGSVVPTGTNLLIVRMSGDEATAILATSQFIAWVVDYVYRQCSGFGEQRWRLVLFSCLGGVASATLAGIALSRFAYQGPWWARLTELSLSACMLLLGLPSLIVCVLLSVALAPFGGQLFYVALFLNVSVEATPSGSWRVHQFLAQRDRSERGLVHSFSYEDPRVLELVSSWMQASCEQKSA